MPVPCPSGCSGSARAPRSRPWPFCAPICPHLPSRRCPSVLPHPGSHKAWAFPPLSMQPMHGWRMVLPQCRPTRGRIWLPLHRRRCRSAAARQICPLPAARHRMYAAGWHADGSYSAVVWPMSVPNSKGWQPRKPSAPAWRERSAKPLDTGNCTCALKAAMPRQPPDVTALQLLLSLRQDASSAGLLDALHDLTKVRVLPPETRRLHAQSTG